MAHIPVLLNETLQYLDPKPGDNFIDCTVGEGGHAFAILKLVAPKGRVLGIDRDADMVLRLRERAEQAAAGNRFIIHQGNFADIEKISEAENFGPLGGILFDFGMSSWQLEESGAGFSFQNIEPLDMRFDRTRGGGTAAEIVNSWPEASLSRVLYEFGEERYARKIAKEIVRARKKARITTTDRLVGVISAAVPNKYKWRKLHFATRTFQALRIAVNGEIENVETGLGGAVNILPRGGRIAAISFHSLEDRIVKNTFREKNKEGSLRIITKKPVVPSPREVGENPRSRSAKLRVAEKI